MRQSQRRGMMNQTPPDPDQPGAAAAQAMSKNMMYIAPFFALTGLYWQFGLVMYWVTTNIWTLGQQHFLFRSLPVVGSATVGASAVQAASGNSGAAKNASGTAAKTGSASAKTAGAAPKAGTAAKTGTKSTSASSRRPRADVRRDGRECGSRREGERERRSGQRRGRERLGRCCGGSVRRRSHRMMFLPLRRPRSSGSSRSGRHAVSAATSGKR